jgi:transcriptional regulator with XRE-family HTH domain
VSETEARRRSTRRRANLTADQVVADQIKALRNKRGTTQQKLADELGETQSMIARVESGKRTISVGELFRISYALDVAPLHLLAASFEPKEVPISNGVRLDPDRARAWVRGDFPIPGKNWRAFYENVDDETAKQRLVGGLPEGDPARQQLEAYERHAAKTGRYGLALFEEVEEERKEETLAKGYYAISSGEGENWAQAQVPGAEFDQVYELELSEEQKRALLAAGWLKEAKRPKEADNG